MLLIVAHHYVVNSGVIRLVDNSISTGDNLCNALFYSIFGAWGKTGINCFVLITGYFTCKSTITLRKFLKLFLWVITYSITITLLFTVCGYHPEGLLKMWLNRIPLLNITDGFTSCFLVFYLCIPFLNALISHLNKKQHLYLIWLLLFIYTLHGSIPKMNVSMNYVSWFSVLYFISSFLRLYPSKNDSDTRFWGYLTALSWGLSIMSILAFEWIGMRTGKIGHRYDLISDSNAILALTNGITSFMWFKNLKIKHSKTINTIAMSSFGVLLIHANSDTMRQWLWKDVVNCVGHYDSLHYISYSVGCVIVIYSVCTIIDYIRIKTIETPILNRIETLCLRVGKRIGF